MVTPFHLDIRDKFNPKAPCLSFPMGRMEIPVSTENSVKLRKRQWVFAAGLRSRVP